MKVLKLVNNDSQAYNLSLIFLKPHFYISACCFLVLFDVADDGLPLETLVLTYFSLGFRNEFLMLPKCALSKMLIACFTGVL